MSEPLSSLGQRDGRAKIALVFPPACDPTAPYLSLAALAGLLRSREREVVLIDANIEAFDRLLSAPGMTAVVERLESRLAALEGRRSLSHDAALAYGALWCGRAEAHAAPRRIEEAKAVLRDPDRFFDESSYGRAVSDVESALRAISAAYHPTHLDFMSYRTPFGLGSLAELELSAAPEANPFEAYLTDVLVPRLRAERVDAVGLSVCFPGQLHPAYLFGLRIKQALPHVHLTMGGPVPTQLLAPLPPKRTAELLAPFDSAVLFEGELALAGLLDALDEGGDPSAVDHVVTRSSLARGAPLRRRAPVELAALPCPDFDGLPLSSYLSPALVLPYDPTRGCYWGRCAFCHYGLAERGTARYRERPLETIVSHLAELSARHHTSHFYLSHDSVAPKTLVGLARALAASPLSLRWGTDLKPEPYVTAARAAILREGGAVACALGIESASDRLLRLIDKGQPATAVAAVMGHLAAAGIAVEAMCFTDFPTETAEEARETLRFVRRHRASIAGFIVGQFGLTAGSRVSSTPGDYGIAELWGLEGDRFGLGLGYAPRVPWKSEAERAELDEELDRLSRRWALRAYPWAGAVSTAHTLLHYARFGRGVFRDRARMTAPPARPREAWTADSSFDLERVWRSESLEREVWARLLEQRRAVTRAAYEEELGAPAPIRREPRRYRVREGEAPLELPRPRRPSTRRRPARRGSPRHG